MMTYPLSLSLSLFLSPLYKFSSIPLFSFPLLFSTPFFFHSFPLPRTKKKQTKKMETPRFVIEASEAEKIAQSMGLTQTQLLPKLVKSAQKLARVPISKFHVAAIGVGISGRIFIGVNLEFPGLPFHHAVHAEQFLLTNLSLNNETELRYLAVSAAPCGHCRQFLQEIRNASNINLLITSSESDYSDSDFMPLLNFLSHPFGPHDLLPKTVPLLLESRENALSFLETENETETVMINGFSLRDNALEAANKSHAPYSNSPSGVALLDLNGNVYKGSYMESAAYNPSLGPLQAAIVAFVAAAGDGGSGGGYDDVVEAILVEKEGAVVKQEHTAELFLRSISPKCRFKTFLCSSSSEEQKK